MEFQIPNFVPLIPEITLASFGMLILLVVAFFKRAGTSVAYYLTQIALVSTLAAVVAVSSELDYTFGQMYLYSPLGDFLKLAVCLIVGGGLLYGRHFMQENKLESGEYYLLILFATLGIMVLVSAGSLLTAYIGLEMLSLASYALVAVNRDSVRSTEAAMKYFVLGALASGLLLYGMSMVYGATQSINLVDIARTLFEQQAANRTVLLFGLVFMVAGIAFKLGVVPFHMWMPDVYEGAPTPVTMFIATASKLAAFAMASRLLAFGLWDLVDHWRQMLLFVAIASVVLGNIAAIAQVNLKRMLAYSGISHMGFMLLGFISSMPANVHHAYASSLFYVLTYAMTTLGAFGIISLMSRAGVNTETIDDFRGLNKRNSWWAAMMGVTMFSMAGIPFFVGFFAKFFVLQAFWQAGHPVLTVLAVLMSLIGAFYYLRVIKVMYFDEPDAAHEIGGSIIARTVLSVNVLGLAIIGLFPSLLMQVCVVVMQNSL